MSGIKAMNGGAAIIRACYGADHPDVVFAKLRAAASDFAFLGIYCYLVAGQDPVSQAQAFLKITGKLAPHEVPILDLEEGDGDQASRADQWATLVDGATGRKSWLYSGLDFAESHGLAPVFDGPRHTWVAAYRPGEPSLGHTLWQSTNGTEGVNVTNWPGCGRCDTNVYHGSLTQLAALTPGGTVPAVPVITRWVTAGLGSLAQLAGRHGTEPAAILRCTAEHSPSQLFEPDTASYINAVFSGKADPSKPMPAGLVLYLPA